MKGQAVQTASYRHTLEPPILRRGNKYKSDLLKQSITSTKASKSIEIEQNVAISQLLRHQCVSIPNEILVTQTKLHKSMVILIILNSQLNYMHVISDSNKSLANEKSLKFFPKFRQLFLTNIPNFPLFVINFLGSQTPDKLLKRAQQIYQREV